MSRALKPPRLRKGDVIGLVSPASTPTPYDKIEGSVRYLEGSGYRVKLGQHVSKAWGYLAGTDEERAEDFNAMIRDPQVRAIFALRGGYGTPRILHQIAYRALARQPKIISGFSDITALQLAIYRKCGLVTFSGPMPAVEFWKNPDPFTEENFWRLLTSNKPVGALANPLEERFDRLKEGKARGVLLGGNLALVTSTIGTRFMPALKGAVLVLEEVDEYPYRVDRMLAQLMNAGVLDRLAGLLLGRFTNCEPKNPAKPHLSTDSVLKEYAQIVSGPVLGNLLYGHVPRKLTIPFGLAAEVNSAKGTIRISESAVA
jgi:muramoyltetrapeptide carboxypeptidase